MTDDRQRLLKRWEKVESSRQEYSRQLRMMAKESVGDRRLRYVSLSNWFKKNRGLDEALRIPDVLAICLPQLNQTNEPIDVPIATRAGARLMGLNMSIGGRFFYLALYATIVFSGVSLLAWGFSNWLMPQFDQIYQEFGISLPILTNRVLSMSRWLRRWGLVFVFIPLVGFGIISSLTLLNRTRIVKKINAAWSGSRNSIADWAWHLSLLLEAGITQQTAMQIACANSPVYFLRNLMNQPSSNDLHSEDLSPETDRSKPDVANRDLFSKEFALLEAALQLQDSPGKPAALRSVASYYWEPGHQLSFWLVQWLITYFLWTAVALFIIAFASMFLPLLTIISGLTGGF